MSIFTWHFSSLAHLFLACCIRAVLCPICTEVGLKDKLRAKSQAEVCVDLFPLMFHMIAPRLMACSGERNSPLGGLISSCGGIELCSHHLSTVIGVSILLEVCSVHPAGGPT